MLPTQCSSSLTKWDARGQNVKHKPVPLSLETCGVWNRAPLSLLYNVWFHVNRYFNSVDVDRKGKETWRSPVFYSSRMKTASGTYTVFDEASKTRWGIDDTTTNYEKRGRMYQRARRKSSAKPLVYTNHCLRATAITLWSDAGLSMTLSGHRNEISIRSSSRCAATFSHLPWIHKPIRKCKSSVGTNSNINNLDPLLVLLYQTSKTSQSKMRDSTSQPSSRAAKSGRFMLLSRTIKHSGIHLEVLALQNRKSFEHFVCFHWTLGISPEDLGGFKADIAIIYSALARSLTMSTNFDFDFDFDFDFWLVLSLSDAPFDWLVGKMIV